ncbi:MAG: hypothetical protein IT306_02565 [Chloroflexi bacterium]|nr:hypothetical protein [Chloroflexota bacterium]
MRRVLIVAVLGAMLAVGVVLGLGARALFDVSQATVDVVTSQPTIVATQATVAQAAPPAAPTAPAKVALTPTPAPLDVAVEVTEGQLESQLNGMLVGQSLGSTPLGDATVQTVSVQLRDGLIQVGGGARAGFLQAPFQAAGTVVPDGNGRPLVKVSQASVGGIDLPEQARNALADSLQTRVDDLLGDRSVKIRTIDIANGKMRVVGTAGL